MRMGVDRTVVDGLVDHKSKAYWTPTPNLAPGRVLTNEISFQSVYISCTQLVMRGCCFTKYRPIRLHGRCAQPDSRLRDLEGRHYGTHKSLFYCELRGFADRPLALPVRNSEHVTQLSLSLLLGTVRSLHTATILFKLRRTVPTLTVCKYCTYQQWKLIGA